jgi:fatty acid desaturase
VTPEELVQDWRYYVAHFQHHRDTCTDTPHGRKLRAIYQAALDSAYAELKMARMFVRGSENPPRDG